MKRPSWWLSIKAGREATLQSASAELRDAAQIGGLFLDFTNKKKAHIYFRRLSCWRQKKKKKKKKEKIMRRTSFLLFFLKIHTFESLFRSHVSSELVKQSVLWESKVTAIEDKVWTMIMRWELVVRALQNFLSFFFTNKILDRLSTYQLCKVPVNSKPTSPFFRRI